MPEPRRLDVKPEQVSEMIQRARNHSLAEEDHELIAAMGESILFLRQAFEEKRISERRLLRMLFGPSTESSKSILENKPPTESTRKQKKKHKGHGKRGVDAYPGAQKVSVPHREMKAGDRCHLCHKGKICNGMGPGVLIRFKASIPITAKVYELQKLRCNLCGEVFTAPVPEEAGKQKYDETTGAMIGVLKYGFGLPFHRIEKLQESVGIPLSASTLWEIVDRMVETISPAWNSSVKQRKGKSSTTTIQR